MELNAERVSPFWPTMYNPNCLLLTEVSLASILIRLDFSSRMLMYNIL